MAAQQAHASRAAAAGAADGAEYGQHNDGEATMKAKTIKLVLRRKIDEWLATIDDEDLRKAAKRDTIVTGGCITSMLLREKINDFDIYFRTRATALRIAEYYVNTFKDNPPPIFKDKKKVPIYIDGAEGDDRFRIVIKSAGIASENGDVGYDYFEGDADPDALAAAQYVGEVMTDTAEIEDAYQEAEGQALETETKPPYRPVFLSTNAITLSNKIQIIIRFWGEPDEIHENYDFVHCTCYWLSKNNHLELRPAALEAMLTRELRYVGSKYPLCSLIRVRKFVHRQWTINAGQILKICMQLNDLNLKDVDVLEDQLTGVDVAYFNEVIHKLREKDKDNVNGAYLLEIIDRMF